MLEIQKLRCAHCGNIEITPPEGQYFYCTFCGATNVVSVAEKFARVEVDKSKEIPALRIRLNDAVKFNIPDDIKNAADKILDIIPDDYTAAYFSAYAGDLKGAGQPLLGFLETPPKEATEEDVCHVLEHLGGCGKLSIHEKIEQYISGLPHVDTAACVADYRKNHAERAQKENDDYAVIPRDVFICFCTGDKEAADRVLAEIEGNGYKCWISSRNLRPNDSINYWYSIKANMKDCALFLAIVSQKAMLSADVQRELYLAKEFKKPRLEYKIDEAPHTYLFKDFFDGITWIDATKGENLCKRIYEALEEIKSGKAAKEPEPAVAKSDIDELRAEIARLAGKPADNLVTNQIEELKRLLEKQQTEKKAVKAAPAPSPAPVVFPPSAQADLLTPLLKRARVEIGDGEFDKAETILE